MTPTVYDQLLQVLRRQPQKLQHLHALARDAGSLWSVDQVHLMFACMDGVTIDDQGDSNPTVGLGERSLQDELADAIADVVRSQGRPVPAAQVLQMLPRKFTTSAEQIKKISREASGLKVVGPGLIDLR